MSEISICDGKYLVTNENGIITVKRHGEDWARNDLVGDGFVLALVQEIERLRTELSELRTKAEAQAVPVALRYQRNDEIWTHVYYSQASCEYLSKKGIRYELLYTAPPEQAASFTTTTLNASCVPDLYLVESFKAQLIESVSPIFWPHIEAASAVIIERMKAAAPQPQQAPSVPYGWKLVPIEPTNEWVKSMREICVYTNGACGHLIRIVLAAAPSPTGLDNPGAPKL